MKDQTENLRIGLLDNGSHSLQRGYEMWSEWKEKEDAWLLKESVIWVHHGVELVLKQLLVQTNEFLVFQDVDRAVERLEILRRQKGMENAGVLDLFEHDDKATSVGFGKLINRVAITLRINELAPRAPLRERIDKLTKYRNSIVHFSLELNVVEVSSLLSEILNPLLGLLSREISDENFKNNSIPRIRKLGQPVQQYIEYICGGAVASGISSTLSAIKGNGRAGVVVQASGTGITQSLLSYVQEVMLHKQIRKKILIFVDRIDMAHQVQWSIEKELPLEPLFPRTKNELHSVLESENVELVISTVQKLGNELFQDSDKYLCVSFSFHSSAPVEKLVSVFPNAIHILFSTTSPTTAERELFGDIVSEYSLGQAIKDELAVPVRIEQVSKDTADLNQSSNLMGEEINSEYLEKYLWSKETYNSMAQYIVEHFKSQKLDWKQSKCAVVTNSISTASHMVDSIIEAEPEWLSDLELANCVVHSSFSGDSNERRALLQRFRSSDDPLSVLICTGALLVGYDNPFINTVYVMSPISRQQQHKLFSLVSRRYPGKKSGLIVDFVGMNWELEA